jgi:uncharacterized protein YggL (DUF469 family)
VIEQQLDARAIWCGWRESQVFQQLRFGFALAARTGENERVVAYVFGGVWADNENALNGCESARIVALVQVDALQVGEESHEHVATVGRLQMARLQGTVPPDT